MAAKTRKSISAPAVDKSTLVIVNPFDVNAPAPESATAPAPTADEVETARLEQLRADSAQLTAETADPTADARRVQDAQLTADRIMADRDASARAKLESETAPEKDTATPPEVLARVERVGASWDYVAVSATPRHFLPADPKSPPAVAPNTMSDVDKLATHRSAMARLAVKSARFSDNANLTAEKMDEGRDYITHGEWYRTAFPQSWGKDRLDYLISESVANVMRFADKGSAKPRPIEGITAEFFARVCESLGIARDVVEAVSYERIKRLAASSILVDKETLSAKPLDGWVDWLKTAVPANVRGASSWTREEMTAKLAAHAKSLADERDRIIAEHSAKIAKLTGETAPKTTTGETSGASTTGEKTTTTTGETTTTTTVDTTTTTVQPETAPDDAPEPIMDETTGETAPESNPVLLAARLAPESLTADQLTAIHRAVFDSGNFEALFGAFGALKAMIRDAQTAMESAETAAIEEAKRLAKLAAERRAALASAA